MAVDDLDVFGSGGRPAEADAPLIVDADAVGVGAVALELLEAVAGRNAQVADLVRGIQDEQRLRGSTVLATGGHTYEGDRSWSRLGHGSIWWVERRGRDDGGVRGDRMAELLGVGVLGSS